jgi:FkbM family methyltransferase
MKRHFLCIKSMRKKSAETGITDFLEAAGNTGSQKPNSFTVLKLQITKAQALLSQSKPKTMEAIRLLEPLAKKKGAPWPVYHFMGIALIQKKMYKQAMNYLKLAVDGGGDEAETWNAISICYFNLAQYSEAELTVERALQKDPGFFKGWLHLGSVYKAQARLNEALKCFQKANKLDPRSAGVAYRIADIYSNQGDHDQALKLFDIAIQIDPDYEEAYNEKAKILQQKGQFEEAKECLNRIISKNPKSISSRVSNAELYKKSGDYDGAIRIYELILTEKPNLAGIRVNYALCHLELGNFEKAEKHYLQAIKDDPNAVEPVSNYLMGLHYNPEHSREKIFEAHKIWDENFSPDTRPDRPVPANIDKDKKIRLGFISGGFRGHPVGWMITEALEYLPKNQFEIYCYTTNNIFDKITKRIHACCDKWQSVIGYSDDVIAGLIKDDEIDILVELSGHAADNRLKMVVQEPAPVIVKWVGGLFNTTGLKAVDYLITDCIETPEGEESFYTEKLVRMPDDYISFMPPDYAPEVKLLPAVENGYITFGCFNNPTKVNPEVIVRWAEILKNVPESRLFLKSRQYDTPALRNRISIKMEELGIGSSRLIFEGQSPHEELLNCYNRVDIALDPWPYSGGLTTCEALWMGVPVITYPGPTFAGRHAATHLVNAGFPEWVANSWDEYVKKATELSGDLDHLGSTRVKLRDTVAGSVLCDGKRFGQHLSNAFREMWKQRVAGYEKNLREGEWQHHIDVEAVSANEIEKTSKNSLNDDDSLNRIRDIEEGSILQHTQNLAANAKSEVNGNGHHSNGISHKKGEQEPDVYKIETKDEVTICTPADVNLMTTWVLLEQGQWYENELNFIRDYLKKGMNVVDAGAGFGVYALPLSRLAGEEGKVFAFEPGALAKKYLEMGKMENGFGNLEIIGKAVSGQNGHGRWIEAETPELNRLDESGKGEVQTVTLDSWWQFEGEPRVDFLKVDVNGDEAGVLSGAKHLLEKESPVILISISETHPGTFSEKLSEWGYRLYEYIPGPGLFAEYNSAAGSDLYLQNVIAVKQCRIDELQAEGWLHDESIHPEEPEAGLWKRELSKLPWTEQFMAEWQDKNKEIHADYLWAIDSICTADKLLTEGENTSDLRNRRATLLLGAARNLIALYNRGNSSTSLAFTLVRLLNLLGKRGQAVEVMQKLIETTKLGQENMNVDLPFMLPIPEQDQAPIKTDAAKWLMVRTIEAWILLKDLTTYLNGVQERKLLKALDGNPEAINRLGKSIQLLKLTTGEKLQEADMNHLFQNSDAGRLSAANISDENHRAVEAEEPIFSDKFWSDSLTPVKARKIAELTNRFTKHEFNEKLLERVVDETSKRRDIADDDNVAFFIQTHALLALNPFPPSAKNQNSELGKVLKLKGWEHKASLYTYWFKRVQFRTCIEKPTVSVIVISNRFKEKSVENLKRLSKQLHGIGELIFVNNGADAQDLEPLIDYVDTFVETQGNSGAYLARNLGALFTKGELLLFVDDDGIPDEGFVESHISVHDRNDIIAARGACYSGRKGVKDPHHYNLGNKIKPAPAYLEGNTSYNASLFFKTDGWGDYILFGHGGIELSYRIYKNEADLDKQIYFPEAKLQHDYASDQSQLKKKHQKQTFSFHLLLAKHAELSTFINSWSEMNTGSARINTPSVIKEVELNSGIYKGTGLKVHIPEREQHRITNIFEKHEYALPLRLKLPEKAVVVDIGANVGMFALYAKQWAKNVTVHCFEPNPQVQSLLELNMRQVQGIHLHYTAVGDRDGELTLYQHPMNTGQTSTTYRLKGATEVKVPVCHAGKMIEKLGLEKIDVLKIDTEGAEVPILDGLKSYLERTNIVMAEYHTEDDRKKIEEYLSEFMLYSAQIEELRGVGTVKYISLRYLDELKNKS